MHLTEERTHHHTRPRYCLSTELLAPQDTPRRWHACRELHEEVGVPPATSRRALQHLFLFPYRDDTCHVWGSAFRLQYDGEVKLQQEEVDWGQFMPLQQVATHQPISTRSFPCSFILTPSFTRVMLVL
jgi:hypothetical protein